MSKFKSKSNFCLKLHSLINFKKIFILISFIITVFILSIIIFFYLKYSFSKYNKIPQNGNIIFDDNVNNVDNLFNNIEDINFLHFSNCKTKEIELAFISIPKIGLYNIQIKEGVDEDVLNDNIGHFKETPWYNGNVGLASHNRGYKKNYFSNINKLNVGDEIYYTYLGNKRKYIVSKIVKIDSYDWSCLSYANCNMLTLITCVSGYENLRLCIQAVENNI